MHITQHTKMRRLMRGACAATTAAVVAVALLPVPAAAGAPHDGRRFGPVQHWSTPQRSDAPRGTGHMGAPAPRLYSRLHAPLVVPAPRFAPQRGLRYATSPARRHWRRGDWLPSSYRRPVRDWRAHRLPAPPHGHQWVHLGSGFAQIAIATGVIAMLIGV